MKVSIRLKTMLGTAIIELVLLSALILVAINFMLESSNEAINKRASTTASLFSSATKDAVISFDLASLDTFTAELLTNPDIVYVKVLDAGGELLSFAGDEAYQQRQFTADSDVSLINDQTFDAEANIIEGDSLFGKVQIGIDTGTINATLNRVKRWTVTIALFEMLLVAVFSYVLGIYLTTNLYRLKQSTAKITDSIRHGEYDHHISPIKSKDELEELSNAFVELTETLIEEHDRKAKYEQELIALNSQLEQRVEKRTESLKKKNIQLEEINHELSETQQQLVQSEKMASVGQMAAGVAHEINNPLGFVVSNLGTLEDYQKDYIKACDLVTAFIECKDKDQRKRLIKQMLEHFSQEDFEYLKEDSQEIIRESINGLSRVTEIVKNLKQFSRADSSEMQDCDVNECIKTALNMVNNELKYHCEITTELNEISNASANIGKIIQVITNLLINAGQAIEKNGRIKIASSQTGDQIYISISDNGKGISEENINKIFDPFFTTKPVGKGTGLGLSICYDIIQEHNGDITVISEINKGTTFNIHLPVNNAENQQAQM